jgi:hypothetical protein
MLEPVDSKEVENFEFNSSMHGTVESWIWHPTLHVPTPIACIIASAS